MNTNGQGALDLVKALSAQVGQSAGDAVDVMVCPPFVYLQSIAQSLGGSNISLGAQDVYFENNGAFTGEISCDMLKDVCCSYVLCGHSERRHVISETDELINKKVKAAIMNGLLPILCVGEKLDEREAGPLISAI